MLAVDTLTSLFNILISQGATKYNNKLMQMIPLLNLLQYQDSTVPTGINSWGDKNLSLDKLKDSWERKCGRQVNNGCHY